MTCRDYLEDHTELLDGHLPHERARALAGHARACPACLGYDRKVRRSLELLRQVEAIDVSDDFALRLQHRLLHAREEQAGALRRSPTMLSGAVAVAGLLALAAWSPWLMEQLVAADAPVAIQEGPAVADGAGVSAARVLDPWFGLTPAAPSRAGVDPFPDDPRFSLPGPSSPVLVVPPATGTPTVHPASTRLGIEFE